MIAVTPEDAYALALIASKPELNADMVSGLSEPARPIGAALAGQAPADQTPEQAEIVQRLAQWARGSKSAAVKSAQQKP